MNVCRPHIPADKRGAFRMSYSPFIDRRKLRGADAVEQMAMDFQTYVANAGSISETDLEILGWSRAQIALHASDARRAAYRRADRTAGR
jgi:hypothetical protein